MFGHLFPSRRSTTSPGSPFKTEPSPEKATAKLPSKLTRKLQALKQALKPRRSGTKVDGQATYAAKQETQEPTSSYEKSGNLARRARSLLNRLHENFSSSTASGLLPAGTTSTTGSAAPYSNFAGPLNAPPTRLGAIVQASSRGLPRLQGLATPSDPEADYPPARKRIRELRAMKANLGCDGAPGIITTSTYHVQVVAPPTSPPPSWEVTALGHANKKPTPLAKLHEVHEERNLLDVDVYQTRRCSSHEKPIRTPAPDPSLWLGHSLYEGPARNQTPVRNRSPLLDAATVPVGQKLQERLTRSRNLDSSRH